MRQYMRLMICAMLAFVFWQIGGSLLWLPFALGALFFTASDLFRVGWKNASKSPHDPVGNQVVVDGLLGEYVIDSTKMHGLFIRLNGCLAFIDVKRDRHFEERKKRAQFLYNERFNLDASIMLFIRRHPSFALRHIEYIGLHSENLLQGEVFWHPEGYTLLRDLEFLDPDTS